LSKQRFREIYFDPKILTLISIAGVVGGAVVAAIAHVFGSSQYMSILIVAVAVAMALFEIWWLNFRYFPSE
jgi:hypothetical protein